MVKLPANPRLAYRLKAAVLPEKLFYSTSPRAGHSCVPNWENTAEEIPASVVHEKEFVNSLLSTHAN